MDDDERLAASIRAVSNTTHHFVGTCRMGGDADSVVDPELRVRGVAGLRIADASVFPSHINGNTHAPTVMIAEKAAAMILAGTVRTAGGSLSWTRSASSSQSVYSSTMRSATMW